MENMIPNKKEFSPKEIEEKSFSIIDEELRNRKIRLDKDNEKVIKRVIHTTADFDFAKNLIFSEGAVKILKDLLSSGVCVCTDTQMAKAGINKNILSGFGGRVYCFMSDEDTAREARERGLTRAYVSMERAASLGMPLIFAIGNAPTALFSLKAMMEKGYEPAFIIAVPVGFVNVEAAKELIIASKAAFIASRGRKGGSAVAASIVNAVLYEAAAQKETG